MLIPLNSYHQNTKHSYNSIRTNPNRVDWNNPPNKFKFYSKDYKRVSLNLQNENYNFLYLICGISAKKSYCKTCCDFLFDSWWNFGILQKQ